MNLDEIIKEWDMFGETLRKPDSDLFKEFMQGVREYKEGIESQENRPIEALFMALILRNHKMISELVRSKLELKEKKQMKNKLKLFFLGSGLEYRKNAHFG